MSTSPTVPDFENSPVSVSVNGLSKVFKVYKKPQDIIVELITRRERHEKFQALDDVSFDIRRGEVVGVIGRNGAGKSTLLKIIAGTLDATGGKVDVAGRVSAILELGTGFDPERTGRENIHLGGLCLGMSRVQTNEKEAAIIEFSELEEFIDQPFKTYSSGMKARLTYSVASNVDADVLIIDEALATGDIIFVQKCLKHMADLCASRTKTVIFVSHALDQIEKLCDRVIWLRNGKIENIGSTREVSEIYRRYVLEQIRGELSKEAMPKQGEEKAGAGGDLRIRSVKICDRAGDEAAVFESGDDIVVEIAWEGKCEKEKVFAVVRIDSGGQRGVAALSPEEDDFFLCGGEAPNGSGTIRYVLPNNRFGPGDFSVFVSLRYSELVRSQRGLLTWKEDAGAFRIMSRHQRRFFYLPEYSFEEENG